MKILFVDDNLHAMKIHVLQLRTVAEVTQTDSVDRALELFRTDPDQWSGVVLDLMMPTGSLVPSGTAVQTVGYHLLLKLREVRPNVPAIILTNVSNHPVLESLGRMQNVKILAKKDNYANAVAALAEQFFKAESPP